MVLGFNSIATLCTPSAIVVKIAAIISTLASPHHEIVMRRTLNSQPVTALAQ